MGLAVLVGPTLGQQPQDPAVRKAATQAAAAAPQPPAPVTVGCVDIGAIFKGYDKVKANSEEFRAAVMAKKNELMKFMAEAQQESETLAKLTPGSVDFKKHEDRITQLKAQHEASREQYEREFTSSEAEMIATLYKEIQAMVGRIAQFRGSSTSSGFRTTRSPAPNPTRRWRRSNGPWSTPTPAMTSPTT